MVAIQRPLTARASAPGPAPSGTIAAPLLGLEAREVARWFGRARGLEAVSFRHEGSGCLAIVGHNGSGKSTLLKLIAGLLRPTQGMLALAVNGQAIAPRDRRAVVGYAAPDLEFYDELSVGENLEFVATARGIRDAARRVRAVLERVALSDRGGDRIAALSTGLKQRVRLAFALLHAPPVLLLDEPGAHLDEEGRALTERLIHEQRRSGLVVLATNDEREARLGDERIQLRGGVGHST